MVVVGSLCGAARRTRRTGSTETHRAAVTGKVKAAAGTGTASNRPVQSVGSWTTGCWTRGTD